CICSRLLCCALSHCFVSVPPTGRLNLIQIRDGTKRNPCTAWGLIWGLQLQAYKNRKPLQHVVQIYRRTAHPRALRAAGCGFAEAVRRSRSDAQRKLDLDVGSKVYVPNTAAPARAEPSQRMRVRPPRRLRLPRPVRQNRTLQTVTFWDTWS